MPLLGTFKQQVGEVMDYYIDYTEWFSTRKDSPKQFDVEPVDGAELVEFSVDPATKMARVILDSNASVDGTSVKVTVHLTTTTDIVKEDDFVVKIKEV